MKPCNYFLSFHVHLHLVIFGHPYHPGLGRKHKVQIVVVVVVVVVVFAVEPLL